MVTFFRALPAAAGLVLGLMVAGPAMAASCASSGLGFSGPTVDGSGAFATEGQACYDFTATVAEGAFLGTSGTGYFTFDAGILPNAGSGIGDGNLFAVPEELPGYNDLPPAIASSLFPNYGFALDILGQTFVDEDSPLAILNVDNYGPLSWAAILGAEGFDNPLILSMESIVIAGQRRNLFASETPGTFDVDLRVEAIPLPAGVWMLMGGLLGLGVLARRRRSAA